ncbi:MAG: hypothetical protein PHQ12_10475, partial [Chthoniobacteraceae bacterium]|nr:hypothetical protein [Chthoniobacteraceae bacterium]
MKPSIVSSARSVLRLVVATLLLASTSHAGAPFDAKNIKMQPGGAYTIHGLSFGMALYDFSWRCVTQKALETATGFPQTASTTWETQGGLKSKSGGTPIRLQEKIERLGDGSFRATYHAEGLRDVPFNVLALLVEMPVDSAAGKTIEVDGAPLAFPANPVDKPLLDKRGVRKVVLPAEGGTLTLEGNLSLFLQDARQWEINLFRARIAMAAGGKTAADTADLAVTITYKPFQSFPLSIASQANRGFRDDVAADGKGGWTDQGPDNDLSALQPGPLRTGNIRFEVIDPARNQGRSCLVLGGSNPKVLPSEAVLPLPGHPVLANLYLLHAGAYIPSGKKSVGKIHVRYADGTAKEWEIVSNRDVGDWWGVSPLPNAAVGWIGKNASSDIGLYLSKFPLENKAVAEVRFTTIGEATWMIAGVAGSPDEIPLASTFPLVIKPGANWIPYEQKFQIQPGSVFDFSSLADAPAGKYGRLIATK